MPSNRRTPWIVGCAVCAAVASLAGCRMVTSMQASHATKDDPKAVAFLKHSMDVYAGLPAFSAHCTLAASNGGEPAPFAQRTIYYARPNLFRIDVKMTSGAQMTSVSNGNVLLEYASETNQPPREVPAPDTIMGASTIQMRHPMFCGSLLYQFFGGSGNFNGLVDASKGAVTFGDEEKTSNGEEGRVVRFYGRQQYGHVEVLIGEQTGYVYRLRYDSEPLMKMMQDPASQRKIHDSAEAALSNAKDARTKAQAEAALSHLASKGAMSFLSEETYLDPASPRTLPSRTFAPAAPKGTKVTDLTGADASGRTPPVPIGADAPDFSVDTVDGRTVILSAFRGHPVVVAFWTTWSEASARVLTRLQALYVGHAARNLRCVAISTEDYRVVQSFARAHHYTFPTAVDTNSSASWAYNANNLPTLAIVDAKGRLSAYFSGSVPAGGVDKALARVGVTAAW